MTANPTQNCIPFKKQNPCATSKTDNPKPQNILTTNLSLESLPLGSPHPLLFSTAQNADFASVPGPGAAVSLLPSVSARQFRPRVPHGAAPSLRFAADGASPAVLWLRGAPPSSTHGSNEEANAVMTPPWWMEKRETFPHKNGRPSPSCVQQKPFKNGKQYRIHIHALRHLSLERLLHALQAPRRWSFQTPLPWTILILVVHCHMLRFPKLQEPLPSWHGQLIPVPRPLQDFSAIFARQSKHLCDTTLKALPQNENG